MKTRAGLHVVHIQCLDVRIVLPPVGFENPCYWFRGTSGSPENRRDALNRRGPDRMPDDLRRKKNR